MSGSERQADRDELILGGEVNAKGRDILPTVHRGQRQAEC